MIVPKLIVAILPLALLIACVGAQKQPPPAQAKESQSRTDTEWETELMGDQEENRPAVRQAAADFVQKRIPECKILGIASLPYSGTTYVAGVDVNSGEKRYTVNLIVRMFVQQGEPKIYWRAEPLSPELAQAILSGNMQRTRKDLEEDLAQESTPPTD